MGKRRATIAQVALLAGVSKTQASNALRGAGRVSALTTTRVRAAAQSLDYQVHPTARALRSGEHIKMVALIRDPQLLKAGSLQPNTFWFRVSDSFTERLAQEGLYVVEVTPERCESLRSMPLQAIVVVSGKEPPFKIPELGFDVPIIALTDDRSDPRVKGFASYDHAAMTREALDHLREQGGTRPTLLCYQVDQWWLATVKDELKRWGNQHGLDPTVTVVARTATAAEAIEVVRQATTAGVDAIYNQLGDSQVVLRGIAQAGLRCPDDVLLLSASEDVSEAQLSPPVSIMALQSELAAELAANLVTTVIAGGSHRITTPHRLIVRESSTRGGNEVG